MEKNISQQVARILLGIKAVLLVPKKPIRFTSGILSPIYVDNRLLCSCVKEREKIVDLLVQRINKAELQPNVIAGTATAGIPHAAWISDKLKLPMVYVRSKPKEHGKNKQIEGGELKPTQNILVVEDMISTGKSSLITINAVRAEKAICKNIIAIYTHELQIASQNFKEVGVNLHALTTFTDVVTCAASSGYIKPEELKITLEWNKNPQEWSLKMEQFAEKV